MRSGPATRLAAVAVALVLAVAAGPANAAGLRSSKQRRPLLHRAAGALRLPGRARHRGRVLRSVRTGAVVAPAEWTSGSIRLAERVVARVRQRGLTGDAAIQAAVDHLAALAGERGLEISLAVSDLGTRRPVAGRNRRAAMNPASGSKVATALFALATLGPRYRFQTRFSTDRAGNLYVQGGFDPSLTDGDLVQIARSLRARGLTRLRGDLVLAAGRSSSEMLPAGYDGAGAEPWAYAAVPRALSVNKNAEGGMRSPDPGAQFADRMTAALREAGVRIDGATRVGPVPRRTRTRHVHRSRPLREILPTSFQTSNNFDHEMIALAATARRIGDVAPTPADAARAIERYVHEEVGLEGATIRNASGLGDANRFSADDLVGLLLHAERRGRLGATLARAFARPGLPGTLEARLVGTRAEGRVAGKTGTDGPATSLTGTIDTRSGRRLGFSVIVSGDPARRTASLEWIDALAVSLSDL